MGVNVSPDIFQEKMSDLMAGLEFVCMCLDNLQIISNSTFEGYLRQLEIVQQSLRIAGLKVNAEKSSFFALEIKYLGYILTKEVLSPNRRKFKQYWIFNLKLP